MQFALSGKNMPADLKAVCERIDDYYPFLEEGKNWYWNQPFKTEKIAIPKDMSEDAIKQILEDQFNQLMTFEKQLKEKMQ